MKVRAIFEKNLYFNEENNFAIFKTTKGTTVKGYIIHQPEELIDVPLILEGEEIFHPKYGRQFEFKNYQIEISGMEFFLKRLVKTIPETTIKEIVKKYLPAEFKKIIYENPKELLKIKGIGEKKLQRIVDNFKKYEHLMELTEFLAPFGISNYFINAIYEKFKNKSIEVLKENPYAITEIKGIGFKKADEVALKLGISLNNINRLKEGLIYTLKSYIEDKKHSFMLKDALLESAVEILKSDTNFYTPDKEELEVLLDELIKEEKIVSYQTDEQTVFTLPHIIFMEKVIFEATKEPIQSYKLNKTKEDILEIIKNYEKNHFPLGEKQKEAVLNFTLTDSNIFILTGYAGSGKTTTAKLILDIYAQEIGKDNIVGCSLSGNASNRFKNVTGYQAFTIHSLLGFQGNEWNYNKNNPLPYKLVVLDEASMVDIHLFYRLIDAIDFSKTKLFLIGDDAQLPPIGIGEIFNDMLKLSSVPKIILDKVFRQKETQVINVFAQSIRKGEIPRGYKKNTYEDFEFVEFNIKNRAKLKKELKEKEYKKIIENNHQEILNAIINKAKVLREDMTNLIQEDLIQEYISYFQVITPTKQGLLGTVNLNKTLKNIINPILPILKENEDFIKIGERSFSVLDKVIHLQNKNMFCLTLEDLNDISSIEEYILYNYKNENNQKRVFNGQMGIISNIRELYDFSEEDEEGEVIRLIEVYYPYEGYFTYYSPDEIRLQIMDLGYAITVHKSQGSEYSNVIMPMTFSHLLMLNNKLLYTAITRAKNKLTIIGESSAFNFACKNKEEAIRNTFYKIWSA